MLRRRIETSRTPALGQDGRGIGLTDGALVAEDTGPRAEADGQFVNRCQIVKRRWQQGETDGHRAQGYRSSATANQRTSPF
jgi:hypothetical protein